MLLYLLPVLAYLAGSVSSAVIVCRAMGLPDPREQGSGNPGATNVLRIGGKRAGVLTLAGDLAKGLIPVLVARALTDDPWILAAVGGAAFLGHLYPVFFRFVGGKGVATALGVYLGLGPWVALAIIATWLVVAAITRISSLSALVAGVASPLFTYLWTGHAAFVWMALGIAILLVWRHRGNIERIANGTESRIGRSRA